MRHRMVVVARTRMVVSSAVLLAVARLAVTVPHRGQVRSVLVRVVLAVSRRTAPVTAVTAATAAIPVVVLAAAVTTSTWALQATAGMVRQVMS